MAEWVRQAAAIPVYDGQVCLVTSSSGRRWVIPKGLIDPGNSASETALKEAWEEAGVSGVLHTEPVGSYFYEKYGGLCHVTVFLLQVTEEAEDWPERYARRRAWVPLQEAAECVSAPGLREILESVLRTQRRSEGGVVEVA